MLIFNKKLSVSPYNTFALKDVHKQISKQKIYHMLNLLLNFIKKI